MHTHIDSEGTIGTLAFSSGLWGQDEGVGRAVWKVKEQQTHTGAEVTVKEAAVFRFM